MRSERPTRTVRSVVGPVCAIGTLLWCLSSLLTSCLNPFPDDQPSANDATDVSIVGPGVGGSSSYSEPPPVAGNAAAGGDNLQGDSDGSSQVPADATTPERPDAGATSGDAGPDGGTVVVR